MSDAIWLIVKSPNTETSTGGLPPTRSAAYLVEATEDERAMEDQQAVDAMVERSITTDMLGCELTAIDAAGASRYVVGPAVQPAPIEDEGS